MFIRTKSFEEWCYENLSSEKASEILSRWDYDLNGVSPKEVGFSSHGLGGKGFWLKCHIHESEQKNIHLFTRERHEGSINCIQCRSLSTTHPELGMFLVNKIDLSIYSLGSHKELLARCPDCGYEKRLRPYTLITHGLCCPNCDDGYYSEKFIANILKQLGILFKPQLTRKTFDWCEKYRYDIYIGEINCIIEIHGVQHFEGKHWEPLFIIQDNDRHKELIARKNGIENYIALDCRKSEIEWIKNSVTNSDLPSLLNFKASDVDWTECHRSSLPSVVKKACELWDNGLRNTIEIARELNMSRSPIIKYLKTGAEFGWCDYNPQESSMEAKVSQGIMSGKRVICLTTGEIFNSQKEATRKYNLSHSSVSSCCSNKRKTGGRHPTTGEALVWRYYTQ